MPEESLAYRATGLYVFMSQEYRSCRSCRSCKVSLFYAQCVGIVARHAALGEGGGGRMFSKYRQRKKDYPLTDISICDSNCFFTLIYCATPTTFHYFLVDISI